MTDHDRFRDDCAAYVLGALEEQEAIALREHIASCVLCRDDLERLSAVAEVLGLGVPALAAPAELRHRVLEQVRAEAALFESAAPQRSSAARARWRLPALRPLGGLVAGALAVGVLIGALVIAPGPSGTRVVSASVAPASRWHAAHAPVALLRASGTQGELILHGLPPAPRGRIYEVWVTRGGRPQPTASLFDATAGGSATVAVPDLSGASAVLVTAERLGGAKVPTMAPLVLARLS
jgi:hypothetical protein